MKLLSFLKETKAEDLDAPDTTLQHREIILRKKFLKNLYIEWYRMLLQEVQDENGKIVEIGSGGGFLKNLDPRVITSDILPFPHCDLTFSGEQMPFTNSELSAILMIDVLHHIPDSCKFFLEAQRVLKPGGKIVMIEPANTPFSRFMFQKFHHENFDPESANWEFPTSGPLSGANGALPWIIFDRDYEKFKSEFPKLQLESIKLHTPFTYLVSGGLTFKSLLPGWMYRPFRWFEKAMSPLNKSIAMFQRIVVVKK
jgi:SAM-dependent methyltransferase